MMWMRDERGRQTERKEVKRVWMMMVVVSRQGGMRAGYEYLNHGEPDLPVGGLADGSEAVTEPLPLEG